MRIEIHGQQFNLTNKIQNYLQTKLNRLERHYDHPCDVRVRLSLAKTYKQAFATATVSGQRLHINANGQTIYAAIDKMVHKLDRLVIKYKEKMIRHQQRFDRYPLH